MRAAVQTVFPEVTAHHRHQTVAARSTLLATPGPIGGELAPSSSESIDEPASINVDLESIVLDSFHLEVDAPMSRMPTRVVEGGPMSRMPTRVVENPLAAMDGGGPMARVPATGGTEDVGALPDVEVSMAKEPAKKP
jgi:hypothetical protein